MTTTWRKWIQNQYNYYITHLASDDGIWLTPGALRSLVWCRTLCIGTVVSLRSCLPRDSNAFNNECGNMFRVMLSVKYYNAQLFYFLFCSFHWPSICLLTHDIYHPMLNYMGRSTIGWFACPPLIISLCLALSVCLRSASPVQPWATWRKFHFVF